MRSSLSVIVAFFMLVVFGFTIQLKTSQLQTLISRQGKSPFENSSPSGPRKEHVSQGSVELVNTISDESGISETRVLEVEVGLPFIG